MTYATRPETYAAYTEITGINQRGSYEKDRIGSTHYNVGGGQRLYHDSNGERSSVLRHNVGQLAEVRRRYVHGAINQYTHWPA